MGNRRLGSARKRQKGSRGRVLLLTAFVLLVVLVTSNIDPGDRVRSAFGLGPNMVGVQSVDEEPKVNPSTRWKVTVKDRVSAEANRPGLKKIYVTVLDEKGNAQVGIKVRFDTEPSFGMAYDHMSVWGRTDLNGYLEWDHLGVPTRYVLYMEDEATPLIENIRTDLGNEYYNPGRVGYGEFWGWRPICKPGWFSYRIVIVLVGSP